MAFEDQEKTEKATPKRREEARRKGQVVTSRELSSAFLILFSVLIFKGFGLDLILKMKAAMIHTYATLSAAEMTPAVFSQLMREGMFQFFLMTIPLIGFIALVGGLSVVVQHGVLFTTAPLAPDWGRINPLSGFKRVFSMQGFVNGAKTFLKFLVIGGVAYGAISDKMPDVLVLGKMTPGEIIILTGEMMGAVVVRCGAVVAVIGAADFGFQWWEHEKKLRMSKQEIKEETKQTEGTPLVKSRIRSLQREMAKKRMMADVPTADVVITNPTRLAVALRYESQSMSAPKVVAKGAGFVAEKIREIARENGVPLVENKPVARSLFKTVEVGQPIPSAVYRAVAEILSYVYKLKGKRA
ncbi:MAG: flagellar biosynthesis protein FlhB [Nitrospiria bacterium]